MKAIEIKRKSVKTSSRITLPEYVVRPVKLLADAMGCRESEIISQLVNYTPGSSMEIVGKGGFTISLNVPVSSLTDEQIQLIADARDGNEQAETGINQAEELEEAKVEVSSNPQAVPAQQEAKQEEKPQEAKEEPKAEQQPKQKGYSSRYAEIADEEGGSEDSLSSFARSLSDDEE